MHHGEIIDALQRQPSNCGGLVLTRDYYQCGLVVGRQRLDCLAADSRVAMLPFWFEKA
jgi:hypothetical protein